MRWPWPWPWSNDLDTQTWPRYGQDVPSYQKWSFYVNWFKNYSPNRQTDTDTHRQTDGQIDRHTDENITSTAYAGGNKWQALILEFDIDEVENNLPDWMNDLQEQLGDQVKNNENILRIKIQFYSYWKVWIFL